MFLRHTLILKTLYYIILPFHLSAKNTLNQNINNPREQIHKQKHANSEKELQILLYFLKNHQQTKPPQHNGKINQRNQTAIYTPQKKHITHTILIKVQQTIKTVIENHNRRTEYIHQKLKPFNSFKRNPQCGYFLQNHIMEKLLYMKSRNINETRP